MGLELITDHKQVKHATNCACHQLRFSTICSILTSMYLDKDQLT